MASVLFPDLAVIDATVGMEGMGPAYGKVKRMGMIVAGRNPLSTDAVAARLMGLDPAEVPHLRLAAGRKLAAATKGLGEIDPQKLSVKPDDYLKWESPFEPPPSRLSIPFPDVTVHDEGSCSACLSTLLVFVQNYYGRLSHGRLQDGKIHLGIGKHLKLIPKGTILIGNCTSKMKKSGLFIQGCPPIASEIWNTLTRNRKNK